MVEGTVRDHMDALGRDLALLAEEAGAVLGQGDDCVHPVDQAPQPAGGPAVPSLSPKPAMGGENPWTARGEQARVDGGKGQPLVMGHVGVDSLAPEPAHVGDMLERLHSLAATAIDSLSRAAIEGIRDAVAVGG